jgi:hypothetical protein
MAETGTTVLPVIVLTAQSPAAALTGLVSSQDEGAMGGVGASIIKVEPLD